MKFTLQSEVIEKLTPRGILAYVAASMIGWGEPAQKLALAVHVPESLIYDGLESLRPFIPTASTPTKKQRKQPAGTYVVPSWIDNEAWKGYEEMRRRIGKPMTDRARELAVKKLEKMQVEGLNHIEVLDHATLNSWQGLFVPRPDDSISHPPTKPKLRETEFAR